MCYNQDNDPTSLTCIEAQGDAINKYCPDCIEDYLNPQPCIESCGCDVENICDENGTCPRILKGEL